MAEKAYIALGSNLGDPDANLNEAIRALDLVPGVKVTKVSGYYVTEPWGYADQPDFTNACCEVETTLSPEALLGVCLGVEAGMGRVRQIKNGPRVIDLDLLLYGEEERHTQELTLPHPRMWEREFVLFPLRELSENGQIGRYPIGELLEELQGK